MSFANRPLRWWQAILAVGAFFGALAAFVRITESKPNADAVAMPADKSLIVGDIGHITGRYQVLGFDELSVARAAFNSVVAKDDVGFKRAASDATVLPSGIAVLVIEQSSGMKRVRVKSGALKDEAFWIFGSEVEP